MRIKTLKYLSIIFSFFLFQQLCAATTGLSFLKIGITPRVIAMGDAYSTFKFEPSVTFYNPATLGLSKNTELQLIHREWFQDSRIEYLGFSTNFYKFRFSVGLNSFSIKNIELRTNPGPPEGTFTSRNAILSISGGYKIDNFLLGLTGKILYEKIHIHEATGLAVDLGTIYNFNNFLHASLSLNNLGKMNALFNKASKLPLNLTVGVSSSLTFEKSKLYIYPTIHLVRILNEHTNHIHLGTEIDYDRSIALRFGMQSGYATHIFSTGFGVSYRLVTFDYAFVPFKYDLGNSHTFSLKITF